MKELFVFVVSFINLGLLAQSFQIGHRTTSPVDSSRNNRVIQDTEIYYPANTAGDNVPVANGQFPVIVFGHGFTIRWDAYNYLWEYFVPRGYICIFPRTEGNISPNHANFGGDLKFLAQWIQQQNTIASSPFYGKVKNKSAVMGHSMGGGSTYLAASGNNVFTTIVSLAAAETNPSAKSAAKQVTCPVLSIAGEEDCVTTPNQHQIPIFDSLASTVKYYIELKGASHCNFTSSGALTCFSAEGLSCSGYGPFISRQEQNTRTIRVAEHWLEFFLKERCASWQQFKDTLQAYITNQNITAHQQIGNPSMFQPAQPTVNPVSICAGNSAILNATDPANATFLWYSQANGGTPIFTGNSYSTPNLNNNTTYYVETVLNTCTSSRKSVTVTVHSAQTPTITLNGNILQASSAVSYQWFLNGNPIPGATQQTYTPTQNGNYTVQITDANGCTATSAPFNYTTTSFSTNLTEHTEHLVIYPNPTQGDVLYVNSLNNNNLKFQIVDLQGRILQAGLVNNDIIKLEDIVEGIYIIKLFKKDFSYVGKFIKN